VDQRITDCELGSSVSRQPTTNYRARYWPRRPGPLQSGASTDRHHKSAASADRIAGLSTSWLGAPCRWNAQRSIHLTRSDRVLRIDKDTVRPDRALAPFACVHPPVHSRVSHCTLPRIAGGGAMISLRMLSLLTLPLVFPSQTARIEALWRSSLRSQHPSLISKSPTRMEVHRGERSFGWRHKTGRVGPASARPATRYLVSH
jgi:hypothetical protein